MLVGAGAGLGTEPRGHASPNATAAQIAAAIQLRRARSNVN